MEVIYRCRYGSWWITTSFHITVYDIHLRERGQQIKIVLGFFMAQQASSNVRFYHTFLFYRAETPNGYLYDLIIYLRAMMSLRHDTEILMFDKNLKFTPVHIAMVGQLLDR